MHEGCGAGHAGHPSTWPCPGFAMRPARATPRMSPCLAGRARTRPVWRCSSSFASTGEPACASQPALPEHKRHGCAAAPPRVAAGPEEGAEEHGQNATPHGSPGCCYGCRVDPVAVGTARCQRSCSTNRRARPLQTAWPGVATRRTQHSQEKRAARSGGSLPRTPLRSRSCRSDGDQRCRDQGFKTGAERNITRKPRPSTRLPGRLPPRQAQRASPAELPHEPPRTTSQTSLPTLKASGVGSSTS